MQVARLRHHFCAAFYGTYKKPIFPKPVYFFNNDLAGHSLSASANHDLLAQRCASIRRVRQFS